MKKTVVIVSGYFNPLHIGHLRLFQHAKELGDILLIILSNDKQQLQKKGKIIMHESERGELVRAIRYVDEVFLSIDEDMTVCKSLEEMAKKYKDAHMIFANGGDRSSIETIAEGPICEKYGIEMRFDVGGNVKLNASSEINKKAGLE